MNKIVLLALMVIFIGCGDSKKTPQIKVDSRVSAAQLKTNRIAFIQLMGMIQHYHPDPASIDTEWEGFAISGLSLLETSHNREKLIENLQSVFHAIAPTVSINNSAAESLPTLTDYTHSAFWYHQGSNLLQLDDLPYVSEVRIIDNAGPDISLRPSVDSYQTMLESDISVDIPLVFPASIDNVYATASSAQIGFSESNNNPSNLQARIVAIGMAWSAMKHFYPYFDEVPVDMAANLRSAVDLAEVEQTELEFIDTLMKVLSPLMDSHIRVIHKGEQNYFTWPLILDFIEEKIVVLESLDEDIKPGDVIVTVNGQDALELLSERVDFVPQAIEKRKVSAASWLLDHIHWQDIEISWLDSNDQLQTKSLSRTFSWSDIVDSYYSQFPSESFYEYESGYFYLNANYFEKDGGTLSSLFNAISDADGLVIDPRVGFSLELYDVALRLSELGVYGPQLKHPHNKQPDQKERLYIDRTWHFPADAEQYDINTAIIVRRGTQSSGETLLGAFMYNDAAIGVGEATHGANGVYSGFYLMNNLYEIHFTGGHTSNADGSQLHAVGILPDVESKRSIEGIRSKRFELIEDAITALKAIAE